MPPSLPDIPEAEGTPLVRQVLDNIRKLQERVQRLEDESARLKGLKTRPVLAPSPLETIPRKPEPGQKRPGSAKRSQTAQLTITDEVIVPLGDVPPDELFAVFESTDSKSRWNFLRILRQPHTDSVINEAAVAYWRRQKLLAAFVENLSQGAQECGDLAAWQARLHALAITGQRQCRSPRKGPC
jgi:hypothetical protein